eukprot:9180308-Ditylum_brightwellii.AAC.1
MTAVSIVFNIGFYLYCLGMAKLWQLDYEGCQISGCSGGIAALDAAFMFLNGVGDVFKSGAFHKGANFSNCAGVEEGKDLGPLACFIGHFNDSLCTEIAIVNVFRRLDGRDVVVSLKT